MLIQQSLVIHYISCLTETADVFENEEVKCRGLAKTI